MKKIITLSLLLTTLSLAYAQDVEMRSITSPVSGCNLSANETVTVVVRTNTDINTSFDVVYTINGGAPVTETIPVTSTILANTNLTYSFVTKADLSTAGTYVFDAYTDHLSDANRTNDTLKGYIVVSDAPSAGGTVTGGGPVCLTGNSGTLTLGGQTGSVVRWETSTNGGTSYVPISNTTTTINYNNISEPTIFRAVVKNGNCLTATSVPDTLTIDSATIGGAVRSGTATTVAICSGSNRALTLSGHRGSVLQWEFSENAGATWNIIANTNTTYTATNITTSTRYRARVKNGSCNDTISSFVTVNVNPPTVAGSVTPDTTVCSDVNSGTMRLTGHTGSVVRWQYSDNGTTWVNIANTTTAQTFTNLTATRMFRALVKSGACAQLISTPATVTVVAGSTGGTVNGSATVCKAANIDTLILTGYSGNIQNWEYSVDGGGSWNNIVNTTDTLIDSNLLVTTNYRAFVQLGTCPGSYSSVATITVDSSSIGGAVTPDATVCSGNNNDILTLSGQRGNILNWEYSTDGGALWTDTANTTTSYVYNNINTTTLYRAEVKNGVCPIDTSAFATITVNPVTQGGTVTGSTTVCSGNNSGTVTLTGKSGDVLNWEFSNDGGFGWTPIVNTDTFQNYINLTTATLYRALVKSGVCPAAYSIPATITVDPASEGGILYGSTTACSGSNSGTLTLVGFSGKILNWESSTDSGLIWNPIADTSFTLSYDSLTQETWYRTVVKSGSCPADTSTIAVIDIDPSSQGGNLSGNDTVCATLNRDTIVLSGHTGIVTGWEISNDDGITWLNISNSTTSQIYNNLDKTTMYRVSVKSGVCPSVNSDTVTVVVDPASDAGTITGAINVCAGQNEGTLTLVDYTGSVLFWQTSETSGATWDTIANTTDTLNYTNVDTTTWYRATVMSGVCNADTSDATSITLKPNPVAFAGTDTTISQGTSITLNGKGGVLFTWTPGSSLNDSTLANPVATPAQTTTYVLTVTDINGCTDTAAVMVTLNADFNITPYNVITPNGDGFNDTWTIENISEYPNNEVVVFNRFGQKVFEATSYNNTWDGTYKNDALPDGSYYYVISFTDSETVIKGAINILKGDK